MMLAEFGTGQVLWSIVWIFLFAVWFWLLIVVFGDLFRDKELSGWAKAAWVIALVFLPLLGILIYLIARGHGMQERAIGEAKDQQAALTAYAQQTVDSDDAADQISKAKSLLDSGAITEDEFQELKQKALA